MADSNGTKVSEKAKKIDEPTKNKVLELNLDNCRKDNIFDIGEKRATLEVLSLINVNLSTLKGFPDMPNLKKLELSDNRISNGLNYLTTSPKLQYLNLSGNKIKDLETLEPLKEFKHLSILDLFNNEVTKVENYREKIFKMVPSLKFLDGFDSENVEAPSDDEEVNGNDSDEEDSADSLGEEEDEDDELNISEIYNEDLEDASSDYEGDDVEEEDDEIESEDDVESDDENAEANKSSTTSAAVAAKADETATQPPGKKRKVDE